MNRAFTRLILATIVFLCSCSDEKPIASPTTESPASGLPDFQQREIDLLKTELHEARFRKEELASLGREMEEAQRTIQEMKRDIRELERARNEVYFVTVLGRVNKPGTYSSPRPITFLEAFGFAGGPMEDADLQNVTFKHRKQSNTIDLENLVRHGHGNNDHIPDGMALIISPLQSTY